MNVKTNSNVELEEKQQRVCVTDSLLRSHVSRHFTSNEENISLSAENNQAEQRSVAAADQNVVDGFH